MSFVYPIEPQGKLVLLELANNFRNTIFLKLFHLFIHLKSITTGHTGARPGVILKGS